MIRIAPASRFKDQSRLHQLRLSAKRWRNGKDAKRRPPQWLRDDAVSAVRAGVRQADVAAAIGMAAFTISRWVRSAGPEAAVRELTLVKAASAGMTTKVVTAGSRSTASVRFPNGICLDVPIEALTTCFIARLLASGGAP